MRTLFIGAVLGCALGVPLRGDDGKSVTYVDLAAKTNLKLKEGYGSDDNTLANLPTGEQTFAGIKFKIGAGVVLLSGKDTDDKPEKVEGIKVGATCSKLHFLHATHYAAKDDTIVGSYTVNYDDKSQQTIPIVYGKDVLDWWYSDDSKEPTRGKVAWKGDNDNAKNSGSKIRLYATTWKNPEPTRKIVSIDFASTNADKAAPFCVAITAQE
jgi:hypothetical protein